MPTQKEMELVDQHLALLKEVNEVLSSIVNNIGLQFEQHK